jgi:hypothetical protein
LAKATLTRIKVPRKPLKKVIVPELGTTVPEMGSVFEDIPPVSTKSTANDIVKPDSDLSLEDKAVFARLLRSGFTLEERATGLIKLAGLTGNKTAAVALRAIQEINAITGITKGAPEEGSPLFVLPEGSGIATSTRVQKK